MRIELNREKMLEKEVTLLEIKSKFCNQWEKRYSDIKNIKNEVPILFKIDEFDGIIGNNKKTKKILNWNPASNIKLLIKKMIKFELNQLTYRDTN